MPKPITRLNTQAKAKVGLRNGVSFTIGPPERNERSRNSTKPTKESQARDGDGRIARTSRAAGLPPARIPARPGTPPWRPGASSRSCVQHRRLGRSTRIEQQRQDGHGQAGNDVDVEDRAPADRLGQPAADRRAQGRRQHRDHAEDGRDHRPLLAGEQGEAGGEHRRHHGPADEALDAPGTDHRLDVPGHAAQRAGRVNRPADRANSQRVDSAWARKAENGIITSSAIR